MIKIVKLGLSYQKNNFTLMASDASEALSDLKSKDVRYLLDVNGHVQLIEGQLEIKYQI